MPSNFNANVKLGDLTCACVCVVCMYVCMYVFVRAQMCVVPLFVLVGMLHKVYCGV